MTVKKKKDFQWVETIKIEKTTDEQYLNIDDSLIELEKNEEMVRMDMNTIEYPIFSKDTRRKMNEIKVYNFKSDGSSYLKVEAPFGYSVPGEFEERVFLALTKIMRNNGYGRTFLVTSSEIIKNLNLEYKGAYVKKLKEAMKLLAKTIYTFKNTLYSSKERGIIEDKVINPMMSIRIISRKDRSSEDIEYFEDGRVKEVYKVSFTDYFYENIITKGYLVFDSNKLLEMKNPITRSMYTMIEKWRGYNLYIKKPAFFIARRIPLSWDKRVISRTVKNIEKSFVELKGMGLIKDYNLVKNKKWEAAEFEIFFSEKHNKLKKESFFKERKEFSSMDTLCITHVEKNIKEIIDKIPINEVIDLEEEAERTYAPKSLIEEKNKKEIQIEYIEEVYKLLPNEAKEIESMKSLIKDALSKYELIYVLGTAEYTKSRKYKSIKGYFSNALKKKYADEYISKNINKLKKLVEKIENKNTKKELNLDKERTKKIENKGRSLEEREKLDNYFISLDELVQNRILEKAKEKLCIKNPEYKNIPPMILKTVLNNCAERYEAIEDYLEYGKENSIKVEVEEEQAEKNMIEKIELLEEFSNFSVFLLNVIKALNKIKLDEENKKAILEILPLIKKFEGNINNYEIKLNYNEENKLGEIIIK